MRLHEARWGEVGRSLLRLKFAARSAVTLRTPIHNWQIINQFRNCMQYSIFLQKHSPLPLLIFLFILCSCLLPASPFICFVQILNDQTIKPKCKIKSQLSVPFPNSSSRNSHRLLLRLEEEGSVRVDSLDSMEPIQVLVQDDLEYRDGSLTRSDRGGREEV